MDSVEVVHGGLSGGGFDNSKSEVKAEGIRGDKEESKEGGSRLGWGSGGNAESVSAPNREDQVLVHRP